jgi:hypothetical protein
MSGLHFSLKNFTWNLLQYKEFCCLNHLDSLHEARIVSVHFEWRNIFFSVVKCFRSARSTHNTMQACHARATLPRILAQISYEWEEIQQIRSVL